MQKAQSGPTTSIMYSPVQDVSLCRRTENFFQLSAVTVETRILSAEENHSPICTITKHNRNSSSNERMRR